MCSHLADKRCEFELAHLSYWLEYVYVTVCDFCTEQMISWEINDLMLEGRQSLFVYTDNIGTKLNSDINLLLPCLLGCVCATH